MVMGRKRKYFNEEEKRLANLEKALRYYHSNKDDCDRRARERYWKKKVGNRSNGIGTHEELTVEPVTELIQNIIDSPDAK